MGVCACVWLPSRGQVRGGVLKKDSQQRMRYLDGITDSVNMSLSKLQETVKDKEAWSAIVHEVPKSWTKRSD